MRGRGWARGLLIPALLAQLTAAAAPGRGGVRSIAEERHAGVVMQRWDLSCGAAALATLLTFDLDDPVSEESIARAMLQKTDPDQVTREGGFSFYDLQTYARGRGYEAEGYGQMSIEDLVARAPAIVPLTLHGYPHFVVFRGVESGRAVLADPAFGRHALSLRRFEEAWGPRVAFVVTAAGADPAPAPAVALPSDDPEEASTRALERALLRQSGMVLQPWTAELSPELSYAYGEAAGVRRDLLVSSLGLRLGLPLRLQAEATVPWVLLDQLTGQRKAAGLGDAELGLTGLLLTEGEGRPALLARGAWKSTTGTAPSDGARGTGTGAHSLHAQLSAVKRDDPVVFFGAVYRVWNLPAGDVDLGDSTGALLSGLLAATPTTSFSVELDVAWLEQLRVAGADVPGTDRVSALATLEMFTVVAPRLLLNVSVGVGLTPSAPDVTLGVALPWRL